MTKKNIKLVFFCHPLLGRRKKGEKRREARGQKKTYFSIKMFGALKRAGSCSTLLGPKISIFQICKNSYFYSICRESWWYTIFGEKAMLERGQNKTNKRIITVLGSLSLMHFGVVFLGFSKRGGVAGGRTPPPQKKR